MHTRVPIIPLKSEATDRNLYHNQEDSLNLYQALEDQVEQKNLMGFGQYNQEEAKHFILKHVLLDLKHLLILLSIGVDNKQEAVDNDKEH